MPTRLTSSPLISTAVVAAVAVGCAAHGDRGAAAPSGRLDARRAAACSAPSLMSATSAGAERDSRPAGTSEPAPAPSAPSEQQWTSSLCSDVAADASPETLFGLMSACSDLAGGGDVAEGLDFHAMIEAAEALEESDEAEEVVRPELTGRTVEEVRIIGARPALEAPLREVLGTAVGNPLEDSILAADVRRLWALEGLDDVTVTASPSGEGVVVTFEVSERPRVGRVFVEAPAGLGDAMGTLARLEGQAYRPGRVLRAIEDAASTLRNEGHLLVASDVRAHEAASDSVDLCLELRPGRRFTVERMSFDGNRQVPDRVLLEGIGTEGGRVNTEGGVYRQDLLEPDLQTVLALLYDHGLLDAAVGAPSVEVDEARGTVRVEVPVEEGPPYTIGDLSVTGPLAQEPSSYGEVLPLEPGDLFVRRRVVEALERLREHHRRRGGAHVSVEPTATFDRDRHTVDLRFVIVSP